MKNSYKTIVASLIFFSAQAFSQTTFLFTGALQTYTVPSGVTEIQIEAYGGQGGGPLGGLGGSAIANVPVTPSAVLEVHVGGNPTVHLGPGGYNGGGAILSVPCGGGAGLDGWPGGGASDVRTTSALADRMVVAGGGGGEGWNNGAGGAGGGTSGINGTNSWVAGTFGAGGTPSSGGAGGVYGSGPDSPAPAGTFGVGGNSSPLSTYCTGGAGGGGWYGGGGGYVSAGGGGSSYVSYPGSTSTSTVAGVNAGHGYIIITEICDGLITSVSSDTVCDGETVTLSATSTGTGTITWDGGVTDGIAFVPPVGTSTYTATSDDVDDCPFSVDITVNALPSVDAGTDDSLCEGQTATLSGSGTADVYSWDGGVTDGLAFTPPAGTTSYTVTGEITATGCESTDVVNVTYTVIDDNITVTGADLTSDQAGAVYQWIDCADSSDIAGATAVTFTPVQDGDYAVVITMNGCQDTSDCVTISGVGLSHSSQSFATIYPNPTTGELVILCPGAFDYKMYSQSGSVVCAGLGSDKVNADLTAFGSGVYFIHIVSMSKLNVIKVVKH